MKNVELSQPKQTKKPVEKKEAKDTVETVRRHDEWKKQQEQKKQERAEAQYNNKIKKQELVADLMRQGNFAGASQALGMTVAELLTLTQNASLSIPTPKKELTPAEQKEQAETEYRKSVEAKLADAESFKRNTIMTNYIRENIDPVFADKDKYELLNMNPQNVPKIKSAVYNFLNEHYMETQQKDAQGNWIPDSGEVLEVSDILDAMENQIAETAKETLENYKKAKKFKTLFEQRQEEEEVEEVEEEPKVVVKPDEEEEEEDEDEDELLNTKSKKKFTGNISNKTRKNVPFALMSASEKMAYMARSTK